MAVSYNTWLVSLSLLVPVLVSFTSPSDLRPRYPHRMRRPSHAAPPCGIEAPGGVRHRLDALHRRERDTGPSCSVV